MVTSQNTKWTIPFLLNQYVLGNPPECFFLFDSLHPSQQFFSYVGKGSRGGGGGGEYQEFQAPQKNIWIFSNPKKFPNSVQRP